MKEEITSLFEAAKDESPVEYIYALLRVHGIGIGVPDQLEKILREHPLGAEPSTNEVAGLLERLVESVEEPFGVLCNLAACAGGGGYNLSPFSDLRTGKSQNAEMLSPGQITSHTAEVLRGVGHGAIADAIDKAFPVDRTNGDRVEIQMKGDPACQYRLASDLVTAFIETYFEQRLAFKGVYPYFKMPRFEVMELLVDDVVGLYGFNLHFSNGNHATYKRLESTTECTNVTLGHPLNFFVGDLSSLSDEWRIGEKRLYEVGLLGRYNGDGEWKPIIYPGDSAPLREEAHRFSSDPDIQGTLFYMMCTGHRCIEFVVRTTVDLPVERVVLGDHFHLAKCDSVAEQPFVPNVRAYDGWYDLEETDEDAVRHALDQIGFGVNLLAFCFGASVDWRVKYRTVESGPGCAKPTDDDLDLLDSALKGFPRGPEAGVLATAIDWYNRGSTSSNVFTAFLCYYIAIESVAIEVMGGNVSFGLDLHLPSKSERRAARLECINEKHAELYHDDPARFVSEAYFSCVVGLKAKTRNVVEAVFGEDSPAVQALFCRAENKEPLSDLRSSIAHGEVSLLVREHMELVRLRLVDIADIARAFIMRLTFKTDSDAAPPTWSRMHEASYSGQDPRSFLVLNTESILPACDWKIRPEWCE